MIFIFLQVMIITLILLVHIKENYVEFSKLKKLNRSIEPNLYIIHAKDVGQPNIFIYLISLIPMFIFL